MLINSSDEELIEKLVAVRGLGRWSVGKWHRGFASPPCAEAKAGNSTSFRRWYCMIFRRDSLTLFLPCRNVCMFRVETHGCLQYW